jgi:ABC-type branched-subunit amino acid transport system substrate-binding protein
VLALGLAVSACGRGDAEDSPGINAEDKVITLGTITDLSGPFAPVGEPFDAGQRAFWAQVNEEGGLPDGWTVEFLTAEDSAYDVPTHAQAFNRIKGNIAALSQSLGTAHTNGILRDATSDNILVGPASLGSNWIWDEAAIQVGTSYCAEAMNVVDFAVEQGAESIAVVHVPGDYGDDAMVGARIAAEGHGIDFTAIETGLVNAGDDQTAAIRALVQAEPDMVFVATTPLELANVIGGYFAQGQQAQFIGSIPTWNAALLQNEALAQVLEGAYMQATSFPTWDADTPGQAKMREAAGEQPPNDWFSLGFSSGYILKAILEDAIANDNVTREGIYEAAQSLTGVDSEGTLPEGSGNYAGDPNEQAVRVTQLNAVDTDASSGMTVRVPAFTGPSAEAYEFTDPCYEMK